MRLRRYEILLPLFYNDGKMVEKEKFLVTHKELVEKFGAATTDTTKIVEGNGFIKINYMRTNSYELQ